MRAIYRHELATGLTGMTAYVFGAFLLLFVGIFMMVYNLIQLTVNFEYVLDGISFIFMIIVPVLTMRIMAEERRQKTDQLLYSLPISMTQVVFGKYFALLTMYLVPMLVIAAYPLILSAFGPVHLPTAYGALCGFFLLGAALISIGVYVSSVTESQAVAAGLCFVVMLLNYFLSALAQFVPATALASLLAFTALILLVAVCIRLMTKNTIAAALTGIILEAALLIVYILKKTVFEGLFAGLIQQLSLFDRFYQFVSGVFDLRAVVYYISVIAVFLALTVQCMEKRRWSE